MRAAEVSVGRDRAGLGVDGDRRRLNGATRNERDMQAMKVRA